ncbi:ferritin-like domain-containing protein [Halosimplex salinum]|uniref:ferritin-like domain-containing protein n=1 Tax=Halosimplex salinum TaxID=1710538 RepID=UPI000F463DF9|nr:ferritin-like domain-containing protein [Halosimplex salinum]
MTRPTDADGRTRRKFLGATVSLAALGLAGCSSDDGDGGASTDAMATDTPTATPTDAMGGTTDTPMATDTPTDEPTDTPTATDAMAAPDVPLLNYALTLEHLENAFYRDGLEQFSDDELTNADALSNFGESVRREVPDYLATVGAHEAAHVSALSDTVEALGGTPVGEGEYDFGYTTPTEFLAVAQALENTGVAAYAGAAPQVVDNDVLAAAAGIHSVEARHASFLNFVNGDSPYPAGVDEAKSIDEVLEIAGGFITSDVDPSVYETGDDRPTHDRKAENDTTDVNVLNYALTLEHLENAFYRDGLAEFSDEQITNADALDRFGDDVRMAVPDHLRTAGAHEAAHVSALSDTVEALGGTPVEEATYDFGYTTPTEFLGVAKALENTGVAAYKGAGPTVSNDDVFAAAIGIHSVEARHAALLNEINASSPFPDGVDEPKTMDEVVEVAGQFIVEE